MRFKDFITEGVEAVEEVEAPKSNTIAFDQEPYVTPALKWLKKRFPFEEHGFTFKHTPRLSNPSKTYQVSIDGNEFDIAGRLHDANSDGKQDQVLFKIIPVEDQEEQKPAAF